MQPDSKQPVNVNIAPAVGAVEQSSISVEAGNNQEQLTSSGGLKPTVVAPPQSIVVAPASPNTIATPDVSTGYHSQLAQLPAEDTDKIEKNWVDEADKIVSTTSSDPYYQDEGQHELSRAYLKQRFGLDVK